jgi:copper chaperone for superoxide dismutase
MDLRTLRQSLAAVAEFKGETWNHGSVVGVVRFVQVRAGGAFRSHALHDLTPPASGERHCNAR